MIFLVTNIDEPKGICSDSPWVAKLSVHSALTAKGTDKVSSCVKDLDSVVVSVGNDIQTCRDPQYLYVKIKSSSIDTVSVQESSSTFNIFYLYSK